MEHQFVVMFVSLWITKKLHYFNFKPMMIWYLNHIILAMVIGFRSKMQCYTFFSYFSWCKKIPLLYRNLKSRFFLFQKKRISYFYLENNTCQKFSNLKKIIILENDASHNRKLEQWAFYVYRDNNCLLKVDSVLSMAKSHFWHAKICMWLRWFDKF